MNDGADDIRPFFEYRRIEIVPSLSPSATMGHNIVYPWSAGRWREAECSVLCVLSHARPDDLLAVDVHDEAFFVLREDLIGDKLVGGAIVEGTTNYDEGDDGVH